MLVFFASLLTMSCERDPQIITASSIPAHLSEFSNSYGGPGYETGRCATVTPHGDYLIIGTTDSFGNGNKDMYLLKTDASGKELWSKTFGGVDNENGEALIAYTDGSYLLLGTTASSGAGSTDIYLVKTDSSGNLLWDKTFGGIDEDIATNLIRTNDNHFLIVGYTRSFGAGQADIYLIKVDQNGNELWSRTYGRTGADGGMDVIETPEGDFLVLGFTDNYGAVARDFYLLKTNNNGDSLWGKIYGGSQYEESHCIKQTADGGFILSGHSASLGDLNHDMFVVKTNANGIMEWVQSYGGNSHDGVHSMIVALNGNLLFAGRSNSFSVATENGYLVNAGMDGTLLWERNYGGNEDDAFYHILETTDAYLMTGNTYSYGNGGSDLFLIKIKKN